MHIWDDEQSCTSQLNVFFKISSHQFMCSNSWILCRWCFFTTNLMKLMENMYLYKDISKHVKNSKKWRDQPWNNTMNFWYYLEAKNAPTDPKIGPFLVDYLGDRPCSASCTFLILIPWVMPWLRHGFRCEDVWCARQATYSFQYIIWTIKNTLFLSRNCAYFNTTVDYTSPWPSSNLPHVQAVSILVDMIIY